MALRHAAIRATGIYVPETEVPNAKIHARLPPEHADFVEKMERRTGILTRYYAPSDWATSDLAVEACRAALRTAKVEPSEIDLIVIGTDSPDYITPATSVIVQDKLGAKHAGTFDVGCACASFPTALAAATGLMATTPSLRRVVVAGAYLMQRLADHHDPMSFFYGDGAGAVLLVASDEPGVMGAAFRADGSYARNWCILSGGTAEPASEESVRAGRTQVRSYETYPRELNEEGWPALVRRLATENDFTTDEVDRFIFTQVRKSTIETVMEQLEQPMSKAELIMDRYGYTGSACIPMALHEAVASGRIDAGDLVVLVGSGVGLNQAAVAVRMTRDLVSTQEQT